MTPWTAAYQAPLSMRFSRPRVLEWVARCRRFWFNSWVRKILWRRTWQPTPVFLHRESHELRSLVAYSPMGTE